MSALSPADQLVVARLDEELVLLKTFRTVLREEQALLENGDADNLPPVSQRKHALANQLATTMQQREQALAYSGFGTGKTGMSAWLEKLPPPTSAEYTEKWQALLVFAEECHNEHALNGKLIAMRLAQNQQAITALLSAGGQPLTYGPDGQQRIGTGTGRTLGSA